MSLINVVRGLINDTTQRKVRVDSMTHTLQVIDYAHHEIHGGSTFCTRHYDGTLSNGDTIILAFKVPSGTKKPHLLVQFTANANTHVDLCEGATWTTGTGSQNSIENHNRDSANTSFVQEDTGGSFATTENAVLNPSGFSAGTIVDQWYSFGEKEKQETGARGTDEWILNDDTQYAVRLVSDEDNNMGFLKLVWYEHTDKD